MLTASLPRPTPVMPGWMRTLLLASCLTLLAAAAPSPGARANQFGNIRTAATVQGWICSALGGEVVITITKIYKGAPISIQTICKGGSLDGLDCTYYPIGESKCAPFRTRPHDGGPKVDVDAIIAGLEAGLSAERILPGMTFVPPTIYDVEMETTDCSAPSAMADGANSRHSVAPADRAPDKAKAHRHGKKKGKQNGKRHR